MISNEEDLFNSQKDLKSKKRIKIILLISIPIIITVSIVLIVIFTKKDKKENNSEISEINIAYNLSTFFFFDPITNIPCTESNYWTPFDNNTSCYRWISIIL